MAKNFSRITELPPVKVQELKCSWLNTAQLDQVNFTKATHGITKFKGFIQKRSYIFSDLPCSNKIPPKEDNKFFIKLYADPEFMSAVNRHMDAIKCAQLSQIPDYNFISSINTQLFIESYAHNGYLKHQLEHNSFGALISQKIKGQHTVSQSQLVRKQAAVNMFAETILYIDDRDNDTNTIYSHQSAYSIDHDSVFCYNANGSFFNTKGPIKDRFSRVQNFIEDELGDNILTDAEKFRIAVRVKAKFKQLKEILEPDEFTAVEENVAYVMDENKVAYRAQREHERKVSPSLRSELVA